MFKSKKDTVYVVLAGIFITNAIVAELIGGKLIHVGSAVMSVGISAVSECKRRSLSRRLNLYPIAGLLEFQLATQQQQGHI